MTGPATPNHKNSKAKGQKPAEPQADKEEVCLRVVSQLSQIGRAPWDRLANPGWEIGARGGFTLCPNNAFEAPEFNPFLAYDFLHALEISGSATPETGWLAQHLALEGPDATPRGIVPAYLKNHSQGEYIFDYGWADAFERAGGRYYPKLQISVPFTPVTARKLLVLPDAESSHNRRLLASGLAELTRKHGASSAHLTFVPQEEWTALADLGFLQRTDQQFHWHNQDFDSFESFLESLSSRKRKAIRKERREALAPGIEIEWLTGSALTEAHWDAFYGFYLDTGARKWGTPYLNRRFFSLLSERQADAVLLIMARRAGRYIAGALNLIGSHALYGRNWGCVEDHPFLHFEVCYYQAIEFAIERGLSRVEAGAQGAHKLARGYLPSTVYSAHYIPHDGFREAIANYLAYERREVAGAQNFLNQRSPFRKDLSD